MLLQKKSLLSVCIFFLYIMLLAQTPATYRQTTASTDVRVNDLLGKLTLPEKIAMLGNNSPAIELLKIPAYNWWNEGLHGVAIASEATIFPQAIGMDASFNDVLLKEVASAVSTEARAK